MVACPTCKTRAEPQARYCPACYAVFPFANQSRNRSFAAETNRASSWKGASLFFLVAALGFGFVQIDADDWAAEPGSYRATAGDTKRKVIDWVASTGFVPGLADDRPEARPAWSLANANQLPCALGAFCEVVIRFDSGSSAAFVLERPNEGGARIIAVDLRGADLLSKSTRAQLDVAAPGGVTRSVWITRKEADSWAIVDGAQLSTTGATAGRPGRKGGV